VEERARAEGGEIDNSQLSRYEKGICYPSFDKLRVLASVFNVSIQSFSDVVDLEGYEEFKPDSGDANDLIEDGIAVLRQGNNGQAFALFERALELAAEMPLNDETMELVGRIRVNQAAALRRLGKLSLAEQELRQAMRSGDHLSATLRARALLALAGVHGDLGDNFLSEMEAERAYEIARVENLDRLGAMALHTLARVLYDQSRFAEAIERYREAARLYAACDELYESIRVKINISACYVMLGKSREGIRLLRSSLGEARAGGHRRMESFAWSNLGKAYFHMKDWQRARSCFRESDALAVYNNEKQPEILFINAFHEWKISAQEENPTREKIAFGRLKALRSGLEQRLPEVVAFDEFVERGRSHA
jgi:tetratricopeptide (TPR) repeat protein